MTRIQQTGTLNREIETLKNEMKNLELNSTITKKKKSLYKAKLQI